jgi:hypothetical protein
MFIFGILIPKLNLACYDAYPEFSMYTLKFQAKHNLGETVRFNTGEGRAGIGKIFAITVDTDGHISYTLEIESGGYSDLEPAILEHQIAGTTTEREEKMSTFAIQTKHTFGQTVRFDSRMQRLSGVGTILAITVDAEKCIDYMVEIERDGYQAFQPGIYEDEVVGLFENGSSQ